MTLAQLFRAVSTLAETGGSGRQYEALARQAESLADMVGWANGPIDPLGQWLERLSALQDDLQQRHAQSGEPEIPLLNDRLARLGQAIAQHDRDLASGATGEDTGEGEDFN
ncbi:MAG: hypothetical protein A2V58_05620 [Candidatus Muproteobacteria bacterium RBG_19FT_COMBO_61_10]|uniref:Uncharacterized protein n=1 Tax=Candidatus Muproteobacteria bacterium RBG_19FT_COMBO_61_10 TaxID=1817761 RepID=A0A1F6UPF3_9PROT|nr:MAG: hypothetical protein A2V58_05620 [Candidatus Muproteobacteria bacterium RBG_19FT_COMBO_61_10]